MKVRLGPRAEADPYDIAVHIAADNPLAGHRWAARLRARCRSLGRFPDRCVIAFPTDPPIRRASEGRHNIYYSVHADHVLVRRILDGARDVNASMMVLP